MFRRMFSERGDVRGDDGRDVFRQGGCFGTCFLEWGDVLGDDDRDVFFEG